MLEKKPQGGRVTGEPITCEEFKERLLDLCVHSSLTSLPHRLRDRHILMKSMVLNLSTDQRYTEKEIDERLKLWLATTGCARGLDHVTLRRQLIEHGYLGRERDGSCYWVCSTGGRQALFEPSVEDIDINEVIRTCRELIRQRKEDYLRREPNL